MRPTANPLRSCENRSTSPGPWPIANGPRTLLPFGSPQESSMKVSQQSGDHKS
jgi:hypothetical protein